MSSFAIVRRAALVSFGVFALAPVVDCQSALAQSARPFSDIRVDVAPLRANAGDPTAAWVQQELPLQLRQALAGRMARNGDALVVRIDHLTLGPNEGVAQTPS